MSTAPPPPTDDSAARHAWLERRQLLGMVHVRALPATPRHEGDLAAIVATALAEAELLRASGFTGLVLENMHDRPYVKRAVGPEIVACMTLVASAVRAAQRDCPIGVQVLAGANREALAVALAAGLDFVRVEGFVFAHVADEGVMESDAAALLRYRRALGAEGVAVFADIKKKHSAHAITADVDLEETAAAAKFFLADGLIVTGSATGRAADPGDVAAAARGGGGLPVLLGSGVTPGNLADYPAARGFIVGSSIKRDGHWSQPIEPGRCLELSAAFRALGA